MSYSKTRIYVLNFFLLLLTNSLSLAIPKIEIKPTPHWVEKLEIKDNSQTFENISDGYYYPLRDFQFNLPDQTFYYHYVRKVYSSSGIQNGSEITVNFDPTYEKLIFHEIKIIREGKYIEQMDPSKFSIIQSEKNKNHHIYDGNLSTLILLEDVRVNDLIEYSFSIVGINPVHKSKFSSTFYLGFYDPTHQLLIRILTDKNKRLNLKYLNSKAKEQVISLENKNIYKWHLENISGLSTDEDIPSWYNPYPRLLVSEYESWQEVKAWAIKLFQSPDKLDEKLQQKILAIKNDGSPPEEKVISALDFVQKDIRYTGLESGISGYKPTSPNTVFQQRFGDCKGKSFLLCIMLKEMGIEAFPALVNTNAQQEINNYLPSHNAFNHCVVQVKLKGKEYWYDPTITNQKGKFNKRDFFNYQFALVLDSTKGGLSKILNKQIAKTEINETYNITSFNGPTKLFVETKYYGEEADNQRNHFSVSKIEEIEKSYLNYYAKNYPNIKSAETLNFIDDIDNNIFKTIEAYTIDNFWTPVVKNDTNNIQSYTYAQFLRDKISIPSKPKRTMPLAMAFPLEVSHNIKLILPEEWNAKNEEKEIKGNGVFYSKKINYKNNVIEIKYIFKTIQSFVAGEETPELVNKLNVIIEDLIYSLSYNRNIIINPGTNWTMILLAFLFLIISFQIIQKLYNYDPIPENFEEARELGGWLIVVFIIIVVYPLFMISELSKGDFFNLSLWENIAVTTSPNFNPQYAGLLIFQLLFNIFSIIYSILIIILFLKRRSSLPRLIKIFFILKFIGVILISFSLYKLNFLSNSDKEEFFMDSFKAFVHISIWIPYFLVSYRVKETFIYRLDTVKETTQTSSDDELSPVANY